MKHISTYPPECCKKETPTVDKYQQSPIILLVGLCFVSLGAGGSQITARFFL
jgi:hypothetical protein